jgi:hypothetical protein
VVKEILEIRIFESETTPVKVDSVKEINCFKGVYVSTVIHLQLVPVCEFVHSSILDQRMLLTIHQILVGYSIGTQFE